MIRSIYFAIAFALIFLSSTSNAQDSLQTLDKTEQKHEMEASHVKELEAFHELLHPLVHDAYPNSDFAAIKEALPSLIESATTLKNASIPKDLAAKKSSFKKESKKLLKQLSELKKKKTTLTDEEFGKKFMDMHDTFEKMMEMTR